MGWVQNDDTSAWYYYDDEVVKGWNRIDGNWYYFNYPGGSMTWDNTIHGFYLDHSGKMVDGTGWLQDGITGDWYYFSGGEAAPGWLQYDGNWYYIDNCGRMVTGWFKDSKGDWYYLKSDGTMATGWVEYDDDGYWYYCYPGGSMAKDTMVDGYYVNDHGQWTKDEKGSIEIIDGKGNHFYYYIGPKGKAVTGWNKIGDNFHYYNYPDGSMTWSNTIDGFDIDDDGNIASGTGWIKDEYSGNWFYYSDGEMCTGWKQVDDKWYYLCSTGEMATGWIKSNGFWYYLQSDGSMAAKKWVNDGIGWYYLYPKGSMARDTEVNGYLVDKSGKMVTGTGWAYINSDWYFLKDDEMVTGWLKDKGYWYYLYGHGSMAHATWIDEYYVDDNGEWMHTMDKNYDSENIDRSDSSDTNNTYEEPRWNDKVVSYLKGTQRFQWFRQETQEGGLKSFFDVGGFDRDENGVYHAKQDAVVQSRAGYNDLYDDVFNLGCSMDKEKFEFETSSEKYIIWIWKGDYLNLGAGAEIGIYKGGGPWWDCDIEDEMPMTLRVEDKEGNQILDWKPPERNWWCTGFNPDFQDRQEQNLTVYGSIDFSKHLDMLDAFYEEFNDDYRHIWDLKTKPIAKFKW